MIKSMTGFGRFVLKVENGPVRVELKSVNHKYFELSTRLPNHLLEFEDRLKSLVAKRIKRGKVHLSVMTPDPIHLAGRLVLDEHLAKATFRHLVRLKKILKIKEPVGLREVLQMSNIIAPGPSVIDPSRYWKKVEPAVTKGLNHLIESRLREGKALKHDLEGRLQRIKKALSAVERRSPAVVEKYRQKLIQRLHEFSKEPKLDSERLNTEVALYAKNSDISEEITRIKSHLDHVGATFRENSEVGRKIDFIAQELYREANTLGAKSNDTLIAKKVILIKSEIEKIREQAQNIE